MIRKKILPFTFLILLSLMSPGSVSAEKKHIVIATGSSDEPSIQIHKAVLLTAYTNMGISPTFKFSPWQRSLFFSDTGKVDAELFRLTIIEEKYKNLVRVDVPIGSIEFSVFTKIPKLKSLRWKDLSKFRVGYLIGVKKVEANLNPSNFNVGVNKIDELITLLKYDRVDIVVENELYMLKSMKDVEGTGIRLLSPALESLPTYHYLHKKNQHLVQPLTNELLRMKKSGSIDRITKGVMAKLIGE